MAALAAERGLKLSEGGKTFKVCAEKQVGFYLARFIEAAEQVSYACSAIRPRTRFDHGVEATLKSAYPQQLKADYSVINASGHQLALPFTIETDGEDLTPIQTVPSKDEKVNWSPIYRAAGKLLDIKKPISAHGGGLFSKPKRRKRTARLLPLRLMRHQ